MSRKDILPSSITFTATQYGLDSDHTTEVNNGHPIPSAKLNLSDFEDLRLFETILNNGQTIDAQLSLPSKKLLPAIYVGLQMHALMMIYGIRWREGRLLRSSELTTASQYCLWQDERTQQVFDRTFNVMIPTGTELNLLTHAYYSFHTWMQLQNFDVATRKLPKALMRLYKESGLFEKNVREDIWYGKHRNGRNKLALRAKEQLRSIANNIFEVSNLKHSFEGNPFTTDALYETLINLYVYNSQGDAALMTGVQPDCVQVTENGEITVFNNKSKTHIDGFIESSDVYDWIQILLESTAGKALAQSFLFGIREKTPFSQPPLVRLGTQHLANYVQGVKVKFRAPDFIDEETQSLYIQDVTLNDDQLYQALQKYEESISHLADPWFKRQLYDFIKARDSGGKGLSPRAEVLDEMVIQSLLFYTP